jgi:hypothetical protein
MWRSGRRAAKSFVSISFSPRSSSWFELLLAKLEPMTTFDEYRAVGFTDAQATLLARDRSAASTLSQGMLEALRAILAAVEGTNTRLDRLDGRVERLDERVMRIEEYLSTSPGKK